MQQSNPYVIAADIGGTHITAALVQTHNWSILPDTLVRNNVDSSADAKSIFRAWTETLARVAELNGRTTPCIGIAMPGPFEYEKGISLIHNQSKYDALYQVNVKHELATRLGIPDSDIRFINDAAAFLQGEVFAGGHSNHQKILGITLGTGLGSAVWERGGNAVDAGLWNTPYLEGIMEEYLVTRWFVRKAKQHGIKVTGLRELLLLREQHHFVTDILAEYSHHLLQFVTFFSEKEGTDKFIIGGNIIRAWDTFRSFNVGPFNRFDIHISQLGEHAALVGAAAIYSSSN